MEKTRRSRRRQIITRGWRARKGGGGARGRGEEEKVNE